MILVTGATGFVGRRFIKLLVKKYKAKDIICFVPNFSNQLELSGIEVLKKLKVNIIYGNLVSKAGFDKLPRSYDLIFNLAANTEVLDTDHKVNDVGMSNLLSHLEFKKSTHFIHISTMVIFSGRTSTQIPILDSTLPIPTNEYSRTKMRGEILIRKYSLLKNFKLTVLRPNTIYGTQGRKNGLIYTINKLTDGFSLFSSINWPGKASLIYVDDIAKLIMYSVEVKKNTKNKIDIYNIDPESLSLSEIASIFFKIKKNTYTPINFPKIFWYIISRSRGLIYSLEKFLPNNVYNWIWRFSLIIDNVLVCDSYKFKNDFKNFKFSRFENKAQELIYACKS